MILDTSTCMPGAPIRDMLPADEMRVIKTFLNEFVIREWEQPFTEVDRRDPGGRWTLWIPRRGGSGTAAAPRSFGYTLTQPVADPAADGKVTILPGWIWVNGYADDLARTRRVAVGETELDISTPGHHALYIQLDMDYPPNEAWSGAIVGTGTSTDENNALSKIDDEELILNVPLLCVKLADNVLSVVRVYHEGNLNIIPLPVHY